MRWQQKSALTQSRNTVIKGQAEVEAGIVPSDRLRAPGAGDKPAIDKQPGLLEALDELVHPDARGTPMSLLRWTLKSTYQLARDLQGPGYLVSAELVRRLLHQMGYSLQAPAKQNEGTTHPDRDGQRKTWRFHRCSKIVLGDPDPSLTPAAGPFLAHRGGAGAIPRTSTERARPPSDNPGGNQSTSSSISAQVATRPASMIGARTVRSAGRWTRARALVSMR